MNAATLPPATAAMTFTIHWRSGFAAIRGSPSAHAPEPSTATNRMRPNRPIARSATTDATARVFRSGWAWAMK